MESRGDIIQIHFKPVMLPGDRKIITQGESQDKHYIPWCNYNYQMHNQITYILGTGTAENRE